MPDLNVPLLRDTLTFITENQDKWDQGSWAIREDPANPACGTAYCLAGHAVLRSGLQIKWDAGDRLAFKLTDGRYIDDTARKLLGLDRDEAEELFGESNDLDDLWDIAEELSDGEIKRPVVGPVTA